MQNIAAVAIAENYCIYESRKLSVTRSHPQQASASDGNDFSEERMVVP